MSRKFTCENWHGNMAACNISLIFTLLIWNRLQFERLKALFIFDRYHPLLCINDWGWTAELPYLLSSNANHWFLIQVAATPHWFTSLPESSWVYIIKQRVSSHIDSTCKIYTTHILCLILFITLYLNNFIFIVWKFMELSQK